MMTKFTVLVCGGRDFQDKEFLFSTLNNLHKKTPISTLIEGGARGADTLASQWARTNKVFNRTFRANWRQLGDAAGPKRNLRMLEEGKPDLVVAFPGGPGTANMVLIARSAGVEVLEF